MFKNAKRWPGLSIRTIKTPEPGGLEISIVTLDIYPISLVTILDLLLLYMQNKLFIYFIQITVQFPINGNSK